MSSQHDSFLTDHLRMWKDSGVPAPLNELQSIAAWLRAAGRMNYEELKNTMRLRMILLMRTSNELQAEGMEAEDIAGIYNNRPELRHTQDVES